MAVRDASAPENRTIAVTGAGTNISTSGTWWHTVVFEQNNTGTSCSLKTGWPVMWPGPHNLKSIYPEAVAIHSDNSIFVTGRTYHASVDMQYFTTVRYKASGTSGTTGSGAAHWWYDWNAGAKGSSGIDIVLDRDGNAYATGYVTPSNNRDYGTIRIPRDWNMISDDVLTDIWDNSGKNDDPASIDLTYEVESGAIKVYAYVTGTTDADNDDSDIATLRYDSLLNLEWAEKFSNGSYDDVAMMVVGAGAGNAYIIGKSNNDYVLLGYRRAQTTRFSAVYYNGPGSSVDEGRALAMAGAGHIRATGKSTGSSTLFDFATTETTQSLTSGRPDEDLVVVGTLSSGALSNLLVADNSYRVYQRDGDDLDPPEKLMVEFYAPSPIPAYSDPSEICIRYEGKCSVSNIKLKIEVYNWVTTSYDVLDYRKVLTSDTNLVLVIKSDPDVYILGTDPEMLIRLTWDETLGTNTYDWTASIDQLSIELIGT